MPVHQLFSQKREHERTILDGIQPAPPRKHIRNYDSNVYTDADTANPEADQVPDHVYLLAGVILCPKADSTEAERPFNRIARVGVVRRQPSIMLQHENLKLEELFEEGARFDGLRLDLHSAVSEIHTGPVGDDCIYEPVCRAVLHVFVPVDLLLSVRPLWQRRRMCPEEYFGRLMDESELTRQGLEWFAFVSVGDLELEKGIVMPFAISHFLRDGREFLIGGHQRRCDVVSQKSGISAGMSKLYDVPMSDDTSSPSIGEFFRRDNDPMIIGVIVRIARHLLA